MNELQQTLRILVALAFLIAAGAKLVLPPAGLSRVGMEVAASLGRGAVVAIAVVELLGAAALVTPALFGAPDAVARVAAAGLSVLLIGAAWMQITRRRSLGAAIALGLLAVTVTLAVSGSPTTGVL
ncbi:MAG: DoxX family protein [Trueperaceae bacterium]|nr:DoxX family protein [Trueperaceae bacterium]